MNDPSPGCRNHGYDRSLADPTWFLSNVRTQTKTHGARSGSGRDAGNRRAALLCADPLLAALVDEHDLTTAADWIVLDSDSTVSGLTDETRTLALAGAPAQWAFPAADTLAGARYAGHAFLRRIRACRTR